MANTLYYEMSNKSAQEIEKAAKFLLNNETNKKLRAVYCNVHIYSNLDLEIVRKDTPNLENWMEDNQGKSDIEVNSEANDYAQKAGYSIEEIMDMQTEVFVALNEIVEMKYAAYSSGFDLSEDSFSLEQIKKITNNGKLLSFTNMFRELYAKVIEPQEEAQLVIPKKQHSTKKLLAEAKANNDDFEWYPTTKEIIEDMYWDIKEWDKYDSASTTYWEQSNITLLDIGAGNGKIFKTIKEISDNNPNNNDRKNRNYTELSIRKAFAIEKSQTLINSLDNDIFVIGVDFKDQTLIDKEVDVIFCNPPFSEFSDWSVKIIKEANAKSVYLVIPQRWESDLNIARAIEQRGAKVDIIGNYDFLESEDRKARAKVHLLKIELVSQREDHRGFARHNSEKDPFNIWFDEVFKIDAQKENHSEYFENKEKAKRIKNLVVGKSLVPRLEELYNEEMKHLMSNYSKVAELDGELLKELKISKKGLKEALKMKIKGLKNLYWRELFNNLETITSRLTSKSREQLLGTLTEHTSIDFLTSNAYSIIIWAIKNANLYYDSQLLSLYFSFSNSKNIRNYKSNLKLIKDGWRYERDSNKHTHFSLDYRIVLGDYFGQALDYDYSGNIRGLKHNTVVAIQDLFTIAKNLGFNVKDTNLSQRTWEAGKNQLFYLNSSSDEDLKELFVEIKAFKNGNLHYRFNQRFMKALNLEAARLNGWIKSPKEASEEFDITEEEASDMFGSNYVIAPSHTNLLPATFREIRCGNDKIIEYQVDVQGKELPVNFKPECKTFHFDDHLKHSQPKEATLKAEVIPDIAMPIYDEEQKEVFASGSLF